MRIRAGSTAMCAGAAVLDACSEHQPCGSTLQIAHLPLRWVGGKRFDERDRKDRVPNSSVTSTAKWAGRAGLNPPDVRRRGDRLALHGLDVRKVDSVAVQFELAPAANVQIVARHLALSGIPCPSDMPQRKA